MGLPSAQPVHRDIAQSIAAPLDERAMASLTCDVAFFSDDSTPAEAIVARYIEQLSDPRAVSLVWRIFDCLRGEYDAGAIVPHAACVLMHIRQAMSDGCELDETQVSLLQSFFERVNGVMFQQQTLAWLADSPFKVHIYGAGWESNSFSPASRAGRSIRPARGWRSTGRVGSTLPRWLMVRSMRA